MQLTEWINLIATVLLMGFVSAFIVQAVKRVKWPSWVKLTLSVVVAVLIALATAWKGGYLMPFVELWHKGMTANDVIAFATLIFTSAAAWYRFYFAGSGWAQTLGNWPGGE